MTFLDPDPTVIHALLDLGRTLHDSMNEFSTVDSQCAAVPGCVQ